MCSRVALIVALILTIPSASVAQESKDLDLLQMAAETLLDFERSIDPGRALKSLQVERDILESVKGPTCTDSMKANLNLGWDRDRVMATDPNVVPVKSAFDQASASAKLAFALAVTSGNENARIKAVDSLSENLVVKFLALIQIGVKAKWKLVGPPA